MSRLDQKLVAAAEDGDLAGVKAALAAGADVHANDDEALCQAAKHGYLEIVETLVAAGADVHVDAGYPLRAASQNGHLSTARCLLDAGADVDADNNAALCMAAQRGRLDVVNLLIAVGANVNKPNYVVLFSAAKGGFAAVISQLIDAGARWQVFTPTIQEYTPAVQVAFVSRDAVVGLSVIDLAKQGVCPEAIFVLLKRQDQAELADFLQGTHLLDTLTPSARSDLLSDMLSKHSHPETPYVAP